MNEGEGRERGARGGARERAFFLSPSPFTLHHSPIAPKEHRELVTGVG